MKLLLFAVAFFVLSQVQAQPSGVAACAQCHGTEGQAKGVPPLAGQPRLYLVRQLDAYAEGRRHHEVMTPIAKGLTPQQRAQLAEYFAQLAVSAADAKAKSDEVPARGRMLATHGDNDLRVPACANCHGPSGVGREPNPYLAGLHAKYLAEALQAWKDGRRDTDPSRSMDVIAKNLSDTDVNAAAAYYAAQEKPAPKAKTPAKKKPAPSTKPGAGTKAPSGVGAEGGAATSGGAQGPGGNAPAPADGKN